MDNTSKIQQYAIQIKPLGTEDGGGFEALYPQLARSVGRLRNNTPGRPLLICAKRFRFSSKRCKHWSKTLPMPETSLLQDAA